MKNKKNYHHGDLKKALVRSALEILEEEGYKALSLRKVALKAGVSSGAPYRHYKDSEELLADVAIEGFKILSEKLRSIISKKPNNYLWQFRESGVIYVEFAIQNRELFRIMYGTTIEFHSSHKLLKDEGERTFQILVDILRNAQKKSIIIDSVDPTELALSAWSMAHGVSMLIVEKQMFFDDAGKNYRKLIQNLIRHLYNGIKK